MAIVSQSLLVLQSGSWYVSQDSYSTRWDNYRRKWTDSCLPCQKLSSTQNPRKWTPNSHTSTWHTTRIQPTSTTTNPLEIRDAPEESQMHRPLSHFPSVHSFFIYHHTSPLMGILKIPEKPPAFCYWSNLEDLPKYFICNLDPLIRYWDSHTTTHLLLIIILFILIINRL